MRAGAFIHQCIRGRVDCGGRARLAHRWRARGDGWRHRAEPLRCTLPRPHLRRWHCRAARGDLRCRARMRGAAPIRRHLLDLPAARLRSDCARRGTPKPTRWANDLGSDASGTPPAQPRRLCSIPFKVLTCCRLVTRGHAGVVCVGCRLHPQHLTAPSNLEYWKHRVKA